MLEDSGERLRNTAHESSFYPQLMIHERLCVGGDKSMNAVKMRILEMAFMRKGNNLLSWEESRVPAPSQQSIDYRLSWEEGKDMDRRCTACP